MFRPNWQWITSFLSAKPGTPKRKARPRLAMEWLEDRITPANAPHLIDLAQFGSTGGDVGRSIAVDTAGNTYVTGPFGGTASFNAGTGTATLTSAGADDVFVAKLDTNGNLVYAQRFGGGSLDFGAGVAVDAAGNAIVTGSFRDTATFGALNLTTAGESDVFVAKLGVFGNLVNLRQFGGTGDDRGGDVAVDGAGNAVVTGAFNNTVDFDPSIGTSTGPARGISMCSWSKSVTTPFPSRLPMRRRRRPLPRPRSTPAASPSPATLPARCR